MNSNNLSNRLEKVASFVPINSRVADIGSDHAYLPIYLVKQQVINFALAGEVAKGPLQNSVSEITRNNVSSQIEARLGDGLAVLQPEDAIDTITIAGMGGILIKRILNDGQAKLAQVKRLILQPNVGEYELRQWLQDNNWQIIREDDAAEDYHLYEIIEAVPGKSDFSEQELQFGPFLMKQRSEVFIRKWNRELQRLKDVTAHLASSNLEDTEKFNTTSQMIEQIKEMLNNAD